ncbi:ABC transporter ATP-binding protein [Corynebacterium sp. CCM 8835]|uniref:ABC transporter ATP-binding protein n=1 Tax=Corynebacterium antarcticum TaxID=2800405 RepID=A0ABS1FLW6_9CORY|nr:ABC transporter ATP-binding protein [Corynebacterium antarcticum]MCK7643028.1 ABC transporter ATP-binding protein [Corynebacterium antarcticum]MCK7661531.1 ABC transporter ATP-binding protein [Corynebacterium antarcticum]MCL0246274.1 ABC transporter ATP-binding protein [Corynebacterium antarcticum]MCX7493015.1 ABC transporter ATP-binding protein [Corynebacterium antarcticum]
MADMKIEALDCGIGRTTILRDVTWSAEPGTMTAIVGVNGVGKSTLLRCLAGITRPHSGEVQIDGRNVHGLPPRKRAKLVTFVGQEETPPGDLTVGETVALGRLPHRRPWEFGGRRENEIVHDSLALVGMEAEIDRPCDQLSGGQRRRVLLARGLAQETPVILLDEPTNHLDVHHQLHLLGVLRSTGRTVIATVHDLDLAMVYFDSVVLLHGDGVLAAGPSGQVLTPDRMRTAFDVGALIADLDHARNPHLIVDTL